MSRLVSCTVNPCTRVKCVTNSELQCRPDYCGCKARWYTPDGEMGQCNDVVQVYRQKPRHGATCPRSERKYCFVHPCRGKTCLSNPDLECRRDGCDGCLDRWYLPTGEEKQCENVGSDSPAEIVSACPLDQIVKCYMNPCHMKKCNSNPGLVCRPDYCGGCNMRWYSPEGEMEQCEVVTTEIKELSDVCDPRKKCRMNPCYAKTCISKPDLFCKPHKCGCDHQWFGPSGEEEQCEIVGERLYRRQEKGPICPLDKLLKCLIHPCTGKTCLSNPSLFCGAYTCGGCNNTQWYTRRFGRGVEQQCETVGHDSQLSDSVANCPRDQLVRCLRNPCKKKTCDSNPELTCRPDYCGGCNARWYTPDGEMVECPKDD